MWYLLYKDPETGTNKWETVRVSGSDEVGNEIAALAARAGVSPDDIMAFFEGDNFNC